MRHATSILILMLLGCGGGGGSSSSTGAPSAFFTISRTSGPAPLYIEVTASADGSWSFGDGATAAGVSTSHLYASPGVYTVTHTVGPASSSVTVSVDPHGPPVTPVQPASGPGGADYAHASVKTTLHGSGSTAYFLYEPQDPVPASAPVLIFLHGWGAVDLAPYAEWITHLVRKGRVVIAPLYQVDAGSSPFPTTADTIAALQSAFVELSNGTHVEPQLDKVVVAGHSWGGTLTANVGALAASSGLPIPKALMCVHPGAAASIWETVTEDFSLIPTGTLLLSIAGEDDTVVPTSQAYEIFAEATSIAAADRNYVLVKSDPYGEPDLFSQHGAPTGPLINALDWYGYWKWLDALCDAVVSGTNKDVALGNTPRQRYMGRWSDGTPVVEPAITP